MLDTGPEGPHVWDGIWRTDQYSRESERERRALRRLQEIGFDAAHVPPNSRILDLGCGSGANLQLLSERCPPTVSLYGVDFARSATRIASAHLPNRVSISVGNATDLPFGTETFSHVMAFGLLEHIRDYAQVLAEIRRTTIRGAQIYVTTSNYYSALHLINICRKTFGRYPYGYQKNWKPSEINNLFDGWASIESLRVVQAAWDMPVVRVIDSVVTVLRPIVGRYMFIQCTKT
jgi:ubiquinone/menaquinone biosynthesis C-methylase UbiE